MAYLERLARPTVSAPILAAIGSVVALMIIIAGNWDIKKGENGGIGPAFGTALICLVLVVGLFGFVVPRVQNTDRAALILGGLAIVSVLAFWSGITPVLATAALAVAGRDESQPGRAVTIVNGLAVVAAALALIVTVAQSNLF